MSMFVDYDPVARVSDKHVFVDRTDYRFAIQDLSFRADTLRICTISPFVAGCTPYTWLILGNVNIRGWICSTWILHSTRGRQIMI